MPTNALTFIFTLISLCTLSACGSSSDSAGNSNKLTEISYTELPSFPRANENQVVTFSLNTSGKNADNLSFTWVVTLLGDELEFTGQNTDTISFVTPEVTGNKPVSISVKFDLKKGTLLGQNSDSTSLTIIDLDPAPEPAELGKSTSLPEVDMLSENLLNNDSTWRLVHFETAITNISDIESRINLTSQRIAYLQRDQSNKLQETFCDVSESRYLNPFNFGSAVSCAIGEPERKFYQNNSGFRMEISCSDSVIYASEYTKISDTKRSNFGSLDIEFEFRDNISLSDNVCGTTATSQVIAPAIGSNPLKISTSTLNIFGEHLNEPFNVAMTVDGPIKFGISFFKEFLDPYNINEMTINSSALPSLDGLVINEDGDITLLTNSLTKIDGNFDAELIDLVGAAEAIDGEFELRFE